MSRRGAIAATASIALAAVLQGCATPKPVVYGPISETTAFGYRDRPNPDGGHTLLVVLPGHSNAAEVRAFWERRAAELCPRGVERQMVFRADRRDTTYINYGTQASVASRVWLTAELEGYVYCKAETAS